VDVAVAGGMETALPAIRDEEGKQRLTSRVWVKALEAGDPLATRLLDEAIQAVGLGVASAVNLLDLDTVVLGGGMAEKLGSGLVTRIEDTARVHILSGSSERRFALAELGGAAGLVGAASLARDALTSQ
jgi:glucokinase